MELKVPTLSERQIIRKIPYAFAKAKGVLLSNVSSERADVHIRKGATVATLAEVRRILGVPLHATLLSLLGIDHTRFSVKFQGLDSRLTGVEGARVVKELLA